VRDALEKANNIRAFVATEGPHSHVPASAATGFRAFNLVNIYGDASRREEGASAPIYNYARFLPWIDSVETVAAAFEEAAEKAVYNRPEPGNGRGSNELVDRYACVDESLARPRHRGFDFALVTRFLIASGLALFLQWGTIGGAITVAVSIYRQFCDFANVHEQWFTPTEGLGCRSASYLLYAVTGTLVWKMMVASSFLAHYAARASYGPSRKPFRARVARTAAILLRRIGKVVAALNAVWGVLVCLLEFGGFFSRCWCNSNVLSLGANAYTVLALSDQDLRKVQIAWILGAWLLLTQGWRLTPWRLCSKHSLTYDRLSIRRQALRIHSHMPQTTMLIRPLVFIYRYINPPPPEP
jgi:hypothetical protein